MLSARRWFAGLLVVVFAVVEGFVSAPQLHLHQGETQTFVRQQGRALAPQASHSTKPKSNDCIACRTFSLATTLTAWLGVAPPTEHRQLAQIAPAVSPAPVFLDDARGRAPPAC